MSTIEIFPCKIYKNHYENIEPIRNLFPKLESIFQETKENNLESMQDGTLCSWFVEANIQKYPEMVDFVPWVEKCASEYWKSLNYYPGLTPFLSQVWANETPKDGWISGHLHGAVPITGSLYVDASPEQGNIVFENPIDSILASQPMDYTFLQLLHHEYPVNSGDLILFPGWMRHHVKPNTTGKKRLILGLHFGSKGTYIAGQWSRG